MAFPSLSHTEHRWVETGGRKFRSLLHSLAQLFICLFLFHPVPGNLNEREVGRATVLVCLWCCYVASNSWSLIGVSHVSGVTLRLYFLSPPFIENKLHQHLNLPLLLVSSADFPKNIHTFDTGPQDSIIRILRAFSAGDIKCPKFVCYYKYSCHQTVCAPYWTSDM